MRLASPRRRSEGSTTTLCTHSSEPWEKGGTGGRRGERTGVHRCKSNNTEGTSVMQALGWGGMGAGP